MRGVFALLALAPLAGCMQTLGQATACEPGLPSSQVEDRTVQLQLFGWTGLGALQGGAISQHVVVNCNTPSVVVPAGTTVMTSGTNNAFIAR